MISHLFQRHIQSDHFSIPAHPPLNQQRPRSSAPQRAQLKTPLSWHSPPHPCDSRIELLREPGLSASVPANARSARRSSSGLSIWLAAYFSVVLSANCQRRYLAAIQPEAMQALSLIDRWESVASERGTLEDFHILSETPG